MSAPIHSGSVAVIGAGVAGLLTAAALLRRGADVLLFGDAASLATGYAYGPAAGEWSLNSRADRMGIEEDYPEGFADWLRLRGPARHGFQPRARYGDYLRHELARLQEQLGPRLRVVPRRVVDLQVERGGWRVRDDGGQGHAAAAAVLAVGAPLGRCPRWVTAAAADSPRFVAEPLVDARLRRIESQQRVLLLGSGLTMVDCVLALLRRGHAGKLVALSRHGWLPAPHAPGIPAAPLQDWCEDAAAQGTRALLSAFRAQLRRGADWRALIDGLRARAAEVWQALDVAERARFERHLATLWSVHRHRLPIAAADELADAAEHGQFEMRAGRVQRVDVQAGKLHVEYVHGGAVAGVATDWLLQCLGIGLSDPLRGNPLLQQLVESGWARPHAQGVGLDLDAAQRARSAPGVERPPLYALGGLARGIDPDQVAVPELRLAAARIASDLARRS